MSKVSRHRTRKLFKTAKYLASVSTFICESFPETPAALAIEIAAALFQAEHLSLRPADFPEPLEGHGDSLYGGDPNCEHEVYSAPGGGVKCCKCPGWFCY